MVRGVFVCLKVILFLLGEGREAEGGGILEHVGSGIVVSIGDATLPDGILDGLFQQADFATRLQTEGFHYLLASDGVLPRAVVVASLKVGKFLTHKLEVLEEALLAFGILTGDVGLAELHEVALQPRTGDDVRQNR